MKKHALKAVVRTATGRAARRDTAGRIPAVLYGHGIPSVALWVDTLAFGRVLSVAGETSVITLTVDGAAPVGVIIRDFQKDPMTGRVTHADLYQVNMSEEITAHVPIVLTGEAPAVRELGGVLVHGIGELPVRCLPDKMPHEIVVDISTLVAFDDHITVADLKIGEGVTVEVDSDVVVAGISAPRVVVEETAAEAAPAATEAAAEKKD